jgi:hypothetical protein
VISAFLVLLLQGAAAAAPPTNPTAAVQEPTRKVCRSYVETGSLVRRTKVCRTAAEWQRSEEDQRQQGRDMVSLINSGRRQ